MSKPWEQILGGYATDTLSEDEKHQLFEAALHDQEVFDALADEESLKALLADSEARHRILASLRATENFHEASSSQKPVADRFSWSSYLPWAGSLAAMVLAFIFGWQMEKVWNPVESNEQRQVQSRKQPQKQRQKQPQKKLSSKDKMVVAKRSQPSQIDNRQVVVASKKQDEESMPRDEKVQSVPSVPPAASLAESKTEKVETLGQIETYEPVDNAARAAKSANAAESDSPPVSLLEQVSQAPDTVAQSNQAVDDASSQAVAGTDFAEVAIPPSPLLTPSAEQPVEQATQKKRPSGPGALDLFYAALADGRHDRSEEKPIQAAIGIRYSFVRETNGREKEFGDALQITGSWGNVRLIIEANQPGFLYVLAPLGRGQWQRLSYRVRLAGRGRQEEVMVEPYQNREFRLGVVTNRMEKLVVSSLRVLFSPRPLRNLGPWLGRTINMSGLQIERTKETVYVVQPRAVSGRPLRVDIPLQK